MSKVDHILASQGRPVQPKAKPGFRSSRTRLLMVALTGLLTAFVFLTQPEVAAAVETLTAKIPGL